MVWLEGTAAEQGHEKDNHNSLVTTDRGYQISLSRLQPQKIGVDHIMGEATEN